MIATTDGLPIAQTFTGNSANFTVPGRPGGATTGPCAERRATFTVDVMAGLKLS